MGRLSRDLGISDRLIYQCIQFFQAIKKVNARSLSWSHYRSLSAVQNAKKRKELESRAISKEWDHRDLQRAINQWRALAKPAVSRHKAQDLLVPKRGKIGLYQVVEEGGTLALDLGFTSYIDLKDFHGVRLEAGDIVSYRQERMHQESGAKTSDLFTYEAELEKIIDADTFWMKIWLKRPQFLAEKLRLRGIDAPELGTARGEAAKRYAVHLFRKAESFVITTTKPDKFDRYLSDIFLSMGGSELFLNNHLLEKGFAVRKDRFDLADWEEM